ncbi:type II secretion system minor pseudopilin GspH [Duganella sp. CY15W]|uniref:type II secretion system minor pseudopilin GspH n=1 Tax=Duganella sp. CY15W TaxID=2692172 RepID=UPI00136C1C2A|nr:type II secretion system minor pseudopilin GspH [Duganella sp. CY15W]MYM29006.1 type II secretion system minor pseudopilin GspH [Duganella sp. CY15W]
MRAGQRGFTLIELLVVMVILGITLGLVSLNAIPGRQQSLQQDAKRVALLLQLARDEAIVRNRQIAFEATPDSYRFLVRNDNKQWEPLTQDDLLRERNFKNGPLTLMLDPLPPIPEPTLRIVFGREPVDKPFTLNMMAGEGASVTIRADGIGHFTVD